MYIFLTSGVKLHIHLLNVVVQFIVFLTLSTLICRSTDISKCFSESLGIRDNGSRLYIVCVNNVEATFSKTETIRVFVLGCTYMHLNTSLHGELIEWTKYSQFTSKLFCYLNFSLQLCLRNISFSMTAYRLSG